MPGGNLTIEIDGNEAKAHASFLALNDDQKKLVAEIGKVGVAAEAAADKGIQAAKREMKERNAQISLAGRLVKSNETVEESYKREVAALIAARKKGAISTEKYRDTVDRLKTKIREEGEAAKVAAWEGKQAFGPGAISNVAKMAGGFITVAAAVGVVREALEFMNAEKEKALGSTESLVDVRRSLRQISKGDFDQLESKADEITQFGVNRVEARQLVFDARSTGFEGEEATVAAANPVIKIEDGAAFAGEFRKFFAGDNLTIEQAFNTALAGAAESQFNISDLLPQIRKAAQGQLSGGESSDVVAATGVLASNFGESTGDRLRALGVKLATTEDTKGLNLIDAVDKLIADPQLKDDVIKDSSELKAVFAKFSERRAEIVAADKRIEAEQKKAGAGGLLGKAISEAYDPTTRAGRISLSRLDANRSAVAREIGQEAELSEGAYSNRAFIDRKVQEQSGTFNKFITDKVLRTQAYFGSDLQAAQASASGLDNSLFGTENNVETRADRNRVLAEQMTVLKDIAENTKQANEKTPPESSFARPLEDR